MTTPALIFAATMTLSSALMILFLIITAALTLYALAQIVAPFFQSREDQLRFEVLDEDLRSIEELVARRSYLLQSLRELQLDHDTGKIPDDDYEETRKSLELEAVKVLRELDEVHGGRGWQDAIDQELSERLEGIRGRRAEELDEGRTTEPVEADEPTEDQTPADQVDCPECGKAMEPDARFCSQCGYAFGDDESESDQTDDQPDAADAASVDEMMNDQTNDVGETKAEVVR